MRQISWPPLLPARLRHSGEVAAAHRIWLAPALLSMVLLAAAPVNFLLFHALAELFAVGVAVTVFAVAWNTFAYTRSSFLLYLGCGYLWVAGLDLVHTLAYQGMGVFSTTGANLATQLWVAGRLFEALLFLSAPLVLKRPLSPHMVLAGGGLAFAALCALIFEGMFPIAYVEGQGLTRFKIASEYVVMVMLLASVVLLWRRRDRMDPNVNLWVTVAVILTILAELAFTLYVQIVSIPMAVGHLLKFWSYWFIYIALVQFTLRNPFQILGRDTGAYDGFPEPTALVDRRGIVRQVNRALGDSLGDRTLAGKPCHDLLHPRELPHVQCEVCRAIAAGTPAQLELFYPERESWQEITLTPFFWSSRVVGMVHVARDVTLRHRTAETLAQERDRARDYLNAAEVMLVALDVSGRVTSFNRKAAAVTGWSESELLGREWAEMLPESERAAARNIFGAILRGEARRGEFYENEIVTRTGERRLIAWHNTPLLDSQGRVLGTLSSGEDVTDRRRQEERLRQAAAVYDTSAEGVMISDPNRRIVAINPAFIRITGFEESDILGRATDVINAPIHDPKFLDALWRQVNADGSWQGEMRHTRKSGETFPVWEHVSALRDGAGHVTHYITVFTDISPLKASEERLDQLAHHDPLTGKPNRLLFHARVAHALERAAREGTRIAVLFVDLDRFKQVNDTYGHAVGDRLLVESAARLEACVRREDTVARMGGDEFTLLLEPLHHPSDAARVAQKIVLSLHEPFALNNHEVVVGASVGISIYPEHGRELSTLLRNADVAMYRAKEQGRNTYRFYTDDLTASARERFALENNLRLALERDELALYYQPQVEVESGAVAGVEALMRWPHREWGMLSPERFISVAEDTGLIVPVDQWVLRTACAQGKRWHDEGMLLHMAVKVSGKQFATHGWLERVEQTLAETRFDPRYLELEITEQALTAGAEGSRASLEKLKQWGITMVIDHFGTGYSSLHPLKQFPIDKLKIDKSLIAGIPGGDTDRSLVRAIIALGHTLRLTINAVGVSHQEQLSFLRAPWLNGQALANQDQYQGFLCRPPLPPADLERWLRESARVEG